MVGRRPHPPRRSSMRRFASSIFRVAPCWWTRIDALSIMTGSLSQAVPTEIGSRSHTPRFAPAQNAVAASGVGTYRSGLSAYGLARSKLRQYPLMAHLSSTQGLSRNLLGISDSNTTHSKSVGSTLPRVVHDSFRNPWKNTIQIARVSL